MNPTQQNPFQGFFDTAGRVLHGAASDIGNIAKGVVSIPIGYVNSALHGQTPEDHTTELATKMGKGIVNEYGDLAGVKTANGQPILPPDKSIFKPGGYNAPVGADPQAAIDHALNHPVNTVLDVLPIYGALKGASAASKAGQAAEAAGAGEAGVAAEGADAAGVASKLDATNPNIFKRGAMKANQIDELKLNDQSFSKEMSAKKTLNEEVPGNSLAEKHANIDPTINRLGEEALSKIRANPKAIPASEIQATLLKKMEPLIASGDMTRAEAQLQVTNYMNRIWDSSANHTPVVENAPGQAAPSFTSTAGEPSTFKGQAEPGRNINMGTDIKSYNPNEASLNSAIPANGQPQFATPNGSGTSPYTPVDNRPLYPEHIDSPTVFDMKKLGNQTTSNLYNKDWSTLTAEQKTNLALRNGMDDIITKYHPDVKALTLKQADLFNIKDALAKGRDLPSGLNLPFKVGSSPISAGVPFSGTVRKGAAAALNFAGDNPSMPSASLNGAASIARGGEMITPPASIPTPAIAGDTQNGGVPGSNKSSNSYNSIKVQPGDSLDMSPSAPGTSAYLTQSDFEKATQGMSPASTQYQILDRQFKADQARANAQLVGKGGKGDLTPVLKALPEHYATGHVAYDDFSKMPTTIWNGFKTLGLDASKLRSYVDNNPNAPYSKELKNIDDLNQKFKGDYEAVEGKPPGANQLLSPSDGPNATFQKWLGIQQFFKGTWSNNKDAYLAAHTYGGDVTPQGQATPVSHPAPRSAGGINPGFAQDNFPTFQGGAPAMAQ